MKPTQISWAALFPDIFRDIFATGCEPDPSEPTLSYRASMNNHTTTHKKLGGLISWIYTAFGEAVFCGFCEIFLKWPFREHEMRNFTIFQEYFKNRIYKNMYI